MKTPANECREEAEKEYLGLVHEAGWYDPNELVIPYSLIQNLLDTERAHLVERNKKLHYELVQEFRDNLITIAIENEYLRGCVTSNQIHDAFENFCASEHQAIDIVKDNK